MGAWSGEPFGNDTAADWLWELDDSSDWDVVSGALNAALSTDDLLDADVASCAIAAAEVVARGIAHSPLVSNQAGVDADDDDDASDESDDESDQDDDTSDSITAFLGRAGDPSADIVQLALSALDSATGPNSELTELWAESGDTEWAQANAKLRSGLGG
jgi:hypothetical protein